MNKTRYFVNGRASGTPEEYLDHVEDKHGTAVRSVLLPGPAGEVYGLVEFVPHEPDKA